MPHWVVVGGMLLAMGSLVGCGDAQTPRVVVVGRVTYRGQDVQQGAVRFVPTGDTTGPSSGATIQNGQYQANAKGGVVVGTHRVEITAVQPRKDPAGRDLAVFEGAGTQYLPAKYNTKSILTTTLESEQGLERNFALD